MILFSQSKNKIKVALRARSRAARNDKMTNDDIDSSFVVGFRRRARYSVVCEIGKARIRLIRAYSKHPDQIDPGLFETPGSG